MTDYTNYEKQIEREKESANAGFTKLDKAIEWNNKTGNASNNDFGRFVKTHILGDIVKSLEKRTSQVVGNNASQVNEILRKCLRATPDGRTTDFFDCEEAGFLGLQKLLDTALNPNVMTSTIPSKNGGDKKLLQKKTLVELEKQIGEIIHKQMSLRFIQKTFPAWFRNADKKAEKTSEGGMRATTAFWEFRIEKAMREFADYLRSKGDNESAELMESRTIWTHRECSAIGALVIHSVLSGCGDYIQVIDGVRMSKSRKPRKVKEIVLTEMGKAKEQQIRDYVADYAHDLLPMLVQPNLITNEKLGGWIGETLQEKSHSPNGSIQLSERHLEFINRQAQTKFEINPFTYELLKELTQHELSLGKFKVHPLMEVPSVSSLLGLSFMGKSPEQDKAVREHPDFKETCRKVSSIKDNNLKRISQNRLGRQIIEKAEKLIDDDYFFIPMDYDFRGRIYSRVPFVSFQSTDAGRYLIRFHKKTPIDDRTQFWFKVGIANAGGVDKVCWDDRVRWFDNNYDEIVNVGKMLDGGDFERAYNFLSKVEDPFALSSIANEFVKVFVDKTQDYTQTFVYVDCSCSGTSIFNAWRQNKHGALMTNLIDTPEPTDIYLEVWNEIKRIAPVKTFRTSHLKRLEQSKLLRKMMKTTYVPASYASPKGEQHKHLRDFNSTNLKKENLHFKDKEMDVLCKLWDVALNKVSSIYSVVSWFQARVDDAIKQGKNTITYTTCNGSVMTLNYPQQRMKKVRTIHYGSTLYREEWINEVLPKVNKRKMKTAITANITHATDASALCEAMWDVETNWVALHDACGFPPSGLVDKGLERLKQGLIDATRHSVWDTFREDNDLPLSPQSAPPIIGDLDLDDISQSNYIYA